MNAGLIRAPLTGALSLVVALTALVGVPQSISAAPSASKSAVRITVAGTTLGQPSVIKVSVKSGVIASATVN